MVKSTKHTFLSAAYEILANAKGPMTPRAITDMALSKGMIETKSKHPDATLRAKLISDKRFGKKGRGQWYLK